MASHGKNETNHTVLKQGNCRLHLTRAVHSLHPFPPIGDAAYRQAELARSSSGTLMTSTCQRRTEPRMSESCAKNLVKIMRVVPEIQTHRHTHHNTLQLLPAPTGEVNTINCGKIGADKLHIKLRKKHY